MQIETLADIDTALAPYYEVTKEVIGRNVTLDRMDALMEHLGHPERRLKAVHVAGTSGKTSTTYYVAALLRASGVKTGHTVSPHVDDVTERVQINGHPLALPVFCRYLEEFLPLVADAPFTPSWFEVLIAFALWVFDKEKVDYAVLETGLGGLQDGTNVAARPDKVCVITDIGYDHMHILGNTLSAIAEQKAGIVHPGNTVLMYEQDQQVMKAVHGWVGRQAGARLLTFHQGLLGSTAQVLFAADLPLYQRRNWLLAYAAARWIIRRDSLTVPSSAALRATQKICIPGRMETIRLNDKTIILDGAHNGQKFVGFAESYQAAYPGKKVPILFALKQGKEISDLAPMVMNIASKVIVTTFTKTQDLPFLSLPPAEVAAALSAVNSSGVPIVSEPDQANAYRKFLSSVDEVGIITGSFFLISQLRELHPELQHGAGKPVP